MQLIFGIKIFNLTHYILVIFNNILILKLNSVLKSISIYIFNISKLLNYI
jgi:hypothetical protein